MILGSNTTESNSFFKISYRIFENKRLFFKKMYEIRMKQLKEEKIKKSTYRHTISRHYILFYSEQVNSKAKKSFAAYKLSNSQDNHLFHAFEIC